MAKPPRPTDISVLGVNFKIVYPRKIDNDDSLGECEAGSRIIKIKAGLSDELFEATLLHETLHAILALSGQAEHLKHDLEEGIVLAIETGLGAIYGRFQ